MIQGFRAEEFSGKRVRLSALMRTKNVSEAAAIWLRVDAGEEAVAFENTESESRRLSGTSGWVRRDIVLDVPAEGEKILIGALLSGDGCVWVDSFTFEVVGDDVALTREPQPPLPAGPVNLDFSQGIN
ncbi:hypothetical protein [Kitasatospora sp. KL5]|uniref:hypothetical protein n=1 Tax=Kitasatospora sp. KL5 TaxID=3425125 RepID=UPI003D6DB862